MSSSSRRNSACGFLLATLLEIIAAGCDPTAPVDPTKHTDGLAADVSRAGSSSGISASPVSWNEIDVGWPAAANASGYQVFRSTTGAGGPYTEIATTAGSVTLYANTGLSAATQYCYEIRS